mmetsp:Transcript_17342/g.42418  ORF Transcript_17342/g.42418 Transcript_17342/m.42418 type:complete len:177 (+) Transcript_17342:281-811(+)
MHKLSVSNPKSKDFQRLDFQSRLEHTISESEPCCYTQKMKLISSTILFASLAMSANANDFPATNFGPGCLNFQNDGSWSQVPDVGNGAFLVTPESPFRFSSDTRFPDQSVHKWDPPLVNSLQLIMIGLLISLTQCLRIVAAHMMKLGTRIIIMASLLLLGIPNLPTIATSTILFKL